MKISAGLQKAINCCNRKKDVRRDQKMVEASYSVYVKLEGMARP